MRKEVLTFEQPNAQPPGLSAVRIKLEGHPLCQKKEK